MWPGPGLARARRASRFQCTTCQPPVPSPRSTAVVLSTTRSPTATGPVSWVSDVGPPEVGVDPLQPGPLLEELRHRRRCGTWALQGGDELLDPLVARPERVLAEDGALGLVVELQVHPVDRVVALALLGPPDELAAEPGPGGLRRRLDGLVDVGVGAGALDQAGVLQLVEEARGRG